MSSTDLIQKIRTRERERERQRASSSQRRNSRDRDSRRTLSYDAPPFYMPSDVSQSISANPEPPTEPGEDMTQYRRRLGERLYPRVRALQPVGFLGCLIIGLNWISFQDFAIDCTYLKYHIQTP